MVVYREEQLNNLLIILQARDKRGIKLWGITHLQRLILVRMNFR